MANHVPTLDIRRYDTDRKAFVAELGAAYREYGFCGICGHGIAQDLIDNSYDVFQRFFALPTETKLKYHLAGTGGARGYTPFGIETAKDSKYFDLKEFWHVGRELPAGSPYAKAFCTLVEELGIAPPPGQAATGRSRVTVLESVPDARPAGR